MEERIKELSELFNLDEEVIEKVIRSQFKFTRDVIEAGEMNSVMLHHFGKIAVKPNRLKFLPENFEDNIHKSGKEIINNKPVD